MAVISSRNNPTIRHARSLLTKKGRHKEGAFLVEGIRFTEEACSSDLEPLMVFYDNTLQENGRGQDLLNYLESRYPGSCCQVTASVLKSITDTCSPQGIVVMYPKIAWDWSDMFKLRPASVIVVDGVGDPGNLGTILRTAAAAGAGGVIILERTVDVYNPKALRASMGAVFRLPCIQNVPLVGAMQHLRTENCRLIGAAAGAGTVYHDMDYTGPFALAVGNEARGLSPQLVELCQETVAIPLSRGVESLNVAIATAVIIYEAARQRAGGLPVDPAGCKGQGRML